jgi:hypothetical protein
VATENDSELMSPVDQRYRSIMSGDDEKNRKFLGMWSQKWGSLVLKLESQSPNIPEIVYNAEGEILS